MTDNEIESSTTYKLIRFVEQHQILHNDVKNGKHDNIKKFLWKKIAAELNITVTAVKKRWRHLRDGFEIYKTILNGNLIPKSHMKYRNWLWGHYLQFLDNADGEPIYVSDDGETGDIKLEPDDDNDFSRPDSIPFQSTPTPEVTQPPVIVESDIDYLFKSFAETFKKYDAVTQATLKMEISGLFFKHEMLAARKTKPAIEVGKTHTQKGRSFESVMPRRKHTTQLETGNAVDKKKKLFEK